jgi:hypothetical protein
VRNEAVLHTVKEERNCPHGIKGRQANCIGCSLHRNCLLKHIFEGKVGGIEVMRRGGRRCKLLLDKSAEMRGY